MTTQPLKSIVPDEFEEVKPGIIREWFCERRIIGYKITTISQALLNDWKLLILDHLHDWDKSRPYLALHDISAKGVAVQYATLANFELMNIGVTAAGRDEVNELFDQNPEFSARVAICFNMSVSGQISQVVMERIKGQHDSIQYKAFFSRDKALNWLFEGIAPANNQVEG